MKVSREPTVAESG